MASSLMSIRYGDFVVFGIYNTPLLEVTQSIACHNGEQNQHLFGFVGLVFHVFGVHLVWFGN